MIELPEALVLAQQINQTLKGKKVLSVAAAQTPHKLTWYNGDPQKYSDMLAGHIVDSSLGRGAMLEVSLGKTTMLFSDGVNLRFHAKGEPRPAKHQLLFEFSDNTALSSVVQMYGGIVCFTDGVYDNKYYKAALEKPSPLSSEFNEKYFAKLLTQPEVQKLSLKAFLATDQRIPGIGNGVLQDILFNAKLHPKQKVSALSADQGNALYNSIKTTLAQMVKKGGRDTEKDLFGRSGGYLSQLSKNTADKPCAFCGTTIKKEAYLGGSIYFCPGCQSI
jgi:formamidopyrimidine-DNA glycosylase